jgi:hypothetical protein
VLSQRRRFSRLLAILLGCLAWQTAIAQPHTTPMQEREKWLARSVFKLVPPPPGAVLHGGGGGEDADYEEWNQSIETALTPTQVVEYYSDEFRKIGWTLGKVTEDGSITLVTGNTREEPGTPRHVLLLASRSTAEANYVGMVIRLTRRVNQEPEPRKTD